MYKGKSVAVSQKAKQNNNSNAHNNTVVVLKTGTRGMRALTFCISRNKPIDARLSEAQLSRSSLAPGHHSCHCRQWQRVDVSHQKRWWRAHESSCGRSSAEQQNRRQNMSKKSRQPRPDLGDFSGKPRIPVEQNRRLTAAPSQRAPAFWKQTCEKKKNMENKKTES